MASRWADRGTPHRDPALHPAEHNGLCTFKFRGFTLVELLVVISIIALLIAILLPSLKRARRQSLSIACLGRCRELGVGMTMYVSEFDVYPPHQIRFDYLDPETGENKRLRWFNLMADLLLRKSTKQDEVTSFKLLKCPSTPDWEIGRNNAYGYNYKYLGSFRENHDAGPYAKPPPPPTPECAANPYHPFERFPVKQLRAPSSTIAFADCDGTGWTEDYMAASAKPAGTSWRDHVNRVGNHGYVVDPTFIPNWHECIHSGGEQESWAWHSWRTYLSDRHLGRSSAVFADGHGELVDPRRAYRDNSMWNGLGMDPGWQPAEAGTPLAAGTQDAANPLYALDPHTTFKLDPRADAEGQSWRYD